MGSSRVELGARTAGSCSDFGSMVRSSGIYLGARTPGLYLSSGNTVGSSGMDLGTKTLGSIPALRYEWDPVGLSREPGHLGSIQAVEEGGG